MASRTCPNCGHPVVDELVLARVAGLERNVERLKRNGAELERRALEVARLAAVALDSSAGQDLAPSLTLVKESE